jgi:hypothetical protein
MKFKDSAGNLFKPKDRVTVVESHRGLPQELVGESGMIVFNEYGDAVVRLDKEGIATPATYYNNPFYDIAGWQLEYVTLKLEEKEEEGESYYTDSLGFNTCKKNWDKWLI